MKAPLIDSDNEDGADRVEEDEVIDNDAKAELDNMAPEEIEIREQEYQNVLTVNALKGYLSERISGGQIHEQTFYSRFMKTPVFTKTMEQMQVVEDDLEYAPTFAELTFAALEVQRIQIYIMLFSLFERVLNGNSMIAILIVAVVEYLLWQLRSSAGKSNLARKSYVDERFLS